MASLYSSKSKAYISSVQFSSAMYTEDLLTAAETTFAALADERDSS